MAKILSISYDPVLLHTREEMLRAMGHSVVSAEGFARAYRECEKRGGDFDLVILGHSIPHEDKEMILEHCPRHCACPVLALLRPHESPLPGAALSLEPVSPEVFLDAVNAVLSGDGEKQLNRV